MTPEALFARADRSAGLNACWPWSGKRNPGGYGRLRYGGRTWYAHRLSYWLTYGTAPEAVCHRCDNPPCINPRHLRAGTLADNTVEMWSKGRANVVTKLTAADAIEARRRFAAEHTTQTVDAIAADLKVSRRTVYRLVYGPSPRYAEIAA